MIFNYIEEGYKYVAIFTNLDNPKYSKERKASLELNLNKKIGFTCCWEIAKSRKFDKILLYIRENNQNKIYIANYLNRESVINRYKIYFDNLEFIDTTELNWKEFTDSNAQNPVRYFP
jgi:hypothetical protein